jgi:cell shape-determining protein MreC
MVYQAHKGTIPPVFARWLVVVILLILLDSTSSLLFLRQGVVWVLTPILEGTGYLVSQQAWVVRYGRQLHRAAQQNLDLTLQIEELRVAADRAAVLEAENKELRSQLELDQPHPVKLAPARVVARDGEVWRVALTTQAKVGSMVLYHERVIGVVTSAEGLVGGVSALGSTGSSQLSLRPVSVDKSIGRVTRSGKTLVVDRVTKEIPLSVGDLLVTTGDGALILPDYPVAKIAEIDSPAEAVYQSVHLGEVERIEGGETVWIVGGGEI